MKLSNILESEQSFCDFIVEFVNNIKLPETRESDSIKDVAILTHFISCKTELELLKTVKKLLNSGENIDEIIDAAIKKQELALEKFD